MRNILYYDYLTQCFRFKFDGSIKETKEQNFNRKLLEDKWRMLDEMDLDKNILFARKMEVINELEWNETPPNQ